MPAATSRRFIVNADEPQAEDDAGVRFGCVLVCKTTKGCRAKLGAVHFAAPHGVVSFFVCPQCGRANHFVNDGRGIRWMSETAFTVYIADRLG